MQKKQPAKSKSVSGCAHSNIAAMKLNTTQ